MSKFKFTVPIQIRYTDFDMLGHLNNATFVTYLEVARLYYFKEIGWKLTDVSNVVAHFDIDFLLPVLPGDEVICKVKTVSLGSKSFQMQYELCSEDGTKSYCRAHSVQVCIDKKSGKATELPEHIKGLINNYEQK